MLILETGLVNDRLLVREIDDDERRRRMVRIVRRGSGSVHSLGGRHARLRKSETGPSISHVHLGLPYAGDAIEG